MTDECYLAEAIAIRPLTRDVREITFKMLDPPVLTFRAGQSISVRGGSFYEKRLKRTYSIASPPSEDRFTLTVRLVGGYKGAEFMSAIAVGDTMSFMPPFGEFVADPAVSRPAVFVATGTGTSPCRAMILDLIQRRSARLLRFYFGAAEEQDIVYEAEFRKIEAAHPNFKYVPTIVKPGPCWNGRRGSLAEVFRHEEELLLHADWYLAGNGAMVDEVKTILTSRGVSVDRIHMEKYFQAR